MNCTFVLSCHLYNMYSIIARVTQKEIHLLFMNKCITLTLVINYKDTQKSIICMHMPWLGVATPQQSTSKF